MTWFLRVLALVSFALGTLTLIDVGRLYGAMFEFASTGTVTAGRPYLALWYALPVLAIVAAHEGGHWWAAHRSRLHTSGPFLFPWPLAWAHVLPMVPAFGLFGAYLKIPPQRYLTVYERFDIAWAGLMGGAVVTGLCTVVGAAWSHAMPGTDLEARAWSPHLIQWITGPGPWAWHPLLAAARFGWLVTVINLFMPLPVSDGWRMVAALPEVWQERRGHVIILAGLCLICGC